MIHSDSNSRKSSYITLQQDRPARVRILYCQTPSGLTRALTTPVARPRALVLYSTPPSLRTLGFIKPCARASPLFRPINAAGLMGTEPLCTVAGPPRTSSGAEYRGGRSAYTLAGLLAKRTRLQGAMSQALLCWPTTILIMLPSYILCRSHTGQM